MAEIISGKIVSEQVKNRVKAEAEKLKEQGVNIGLAVVIVGNDPASRVYVNSKKKACEYVGFNSYEYALDENITQQELLDLVEVLNNDRKVNGILVQLPLPKHIDENAIINAISPEKDVDAFHPFNVGKIMIGDFAFLPCTPAGVMAEVILSANLWQCSSSTEAVLLQFVTQKLRTLRKSAKTPIFSLPVSESLISLPLTWLKKGLL